jgi:hypothetical protein
MIKREYKIKPLFSRPGLDTFCLEVFVEGYGWQNHGIGQRKYIERKMKRMQEQDRYTVPMNEFLANLYK